MTNTKLDFTETILQELSKSYNIDQKYVKQLLLEELNKYTLDKSELPMCSSDMLADIQYFIQLKKLEGVARSTLEVYATELSVFSRFTGKSAGACTIRDLRNYIADAQQRQLKRTTLNSKITVLRTFFHTLFVEEVISQDPAIKLKLFKVDTSALRTCLTIEELEKLRNACTDERERVIVEFLFATGCRISEVLALTIQDIGWLDNSLTVVGKGSKIRKVFFTPKCKLYLQDYISGRPSKYDALLTNYRYPYAPIGKSGLERALSRIVARADIKKSVSPHVLRHTMASSNVQHGMDLLTVSKLLGHSKLSTTQIYTHLTDSHLKATYDKFM